MRSDHHKVICERQRRGSGKKYHDYRHVKETAINDEIFDDFEENDINIESHKLSEPMQRPYKQDYNEKEFSDMNSGIRGYIRKSVGRKWDDVFSEFCEIYDQRSILTKHLFQHMKSLVCTKVVEKDNELYVHARRKVSTLAKSWEEYYVDPRDGILKINSDYVDWRHNRRLYNQARQEERDKNQKVVDRLHEYHLIDGTWFLVTFVECPSKRVLTSSYSHYRDRINYYYADEYPIKYDILKKETVSGKRYAASKRTASKKEIRDYQLNKSVDSIAA